MSVIVLAFVLTGCGPSEEKAATEEKQDKETVTEQLAETAHALCRDCHKQEGAGPTGCRGCHQK